ncbi:hypothetical protein C122C_0806 [Leuconostoc gelidum subsp. gasicomitatum]|uniref:Uncharacterized protein n=1 Tax=Leuconostoc gasicomitatum TaxID=115778 RepID=A0ABM9V3F5_9LACO|nr:hypothetical protein [Leuconostoc gasicomitatum]CUW10460.1 hypothetical protein C122C_0806 [Leuconostoc gasicomitatum]
MIDKKISVKRLVGLLFITLMMFVIITCLLDKYLLGKTLLFFKFDLYIVRIIEVVGTIILTLPFTYKYISSITIFGASVQLALEKVSVEYKEFKSTMRPLIIFELTKIETEGRIHSVSIDSLLDFISNTEKIVENMYETDKTMNDGLLRARLKVIELSAEKISKYIVESKLSDYFVNQDENISLFDLVRKYIKSGLSFSVPKKIGEVSVDINGLKKDLSNYNIDWSNDTTLIQMLNEVDKYYRENKDKFIIPSA